MQTRLPAQQDTETKAMKGQRMKKVYIMIPAFEPDRDFGNYVAELAGCIRGEIVIVDDGSGPEYEQIFEMLEEMEGCVVLTHQKNKGKGEALKTGFRYLLSKDKGKKQIVCVDSDGQHAVTDIARILEAVEKNPGCLVLGERSFSGANVPVRSKMGNRISSVLFYIASGEWLEDTQTGFRAFDETLLDFLLQIPGKRFEYEMQMLDFCVRNKIPIYTEKIQTIYLNNNEGSHFRPIRDSIRVAGVFFRNFFSFLFSSVLCAVADIFLFWIVLYWLTQNGYGSVYTWILLATIVARLLSVGINYIVNKNYVFHCMEKRKSAVRYAILCIGIAAASAIGVSVMNRLFLMEPQWLKMWCDILLFFVSYWMQKKWVFSDGKEIAYES